MFAGDPDCSGDAPIGDQMTPEAGHLGPRSADSLTRLRWPLIPNVLTYVGWDEKDRAYILSHLDQLVVKATNEAGGYGMMVGPHATKTQREECAARIQVDPRNYIAQPTLALSRVPTLVEDHLEGRHVDLRPYIL